MTCRTVTALCVALSASSAAPSWANLVSNGGFETQNLDQNNNPIPPPPDWEITGDGIVIDTAFPNTGTYDMSFGAASNDPNPGILSQSIATVPGQSYDLSFALLDQSGLPTNSFVVTFGGFSATITGGQAASYTTEAFDVPGTDITGSSTTLSFSGANDTSAWNLDDVFVSATAIPEPSTGLLVGISVVMGLSFAGRSGRACGVFRPRRHGDG